jgi:hypothetical protein
MAVELIFAPEVEWDVLEASAWYEYGYSGSALVLTRSAAAVALVNYH